MAISSVFLNLLNIRTIRNSKQDAIYSGGESEQVIY